MDLKDLVSSCGKKVPWVRLTLKTKMMMMMKKMMGAVVRMKKRMQWNHFVERSTSKLLEGRLLGSMKNMIFFFECSRHDFGQCCGVLSSFFFLGFELKTYMDLFQYTVGIDVVVVDDDDDDGC